MMIELQAAFKLFDQENAGKILLREMQACMEAFGIKAKKSELKHELKVLGIKLEDGITYESFIKIIGPRLGDRYSFEEISKTFTLFDLDNQNGISFKNLKEITQEIGEEIEEEELYEMFEEADRTNSGYINQKEFYRIMRKRDDPLDGLSDNEQDEF